MKKMDGNKQEKYVLLHDDSDLEEFDRSKSALMTSQDGKVCFGKPESRRYRSWKQCPWLVYSFLILLLIASQIITGVFLLITRWDLEIMSHNQAMMLSYETNYSSSVEYNTSSTALESERHQHKDDAMSLAHSGNQGLKTLWNQYTSVDQRLKTLEIRMQFLEVITSSRRKMVDAPGSKSSGEEAKNAVDSQIKELEGSLLNLTLVVNSLQRHLEKGLETAFYQISRLHNEVYTTMKSANHEKSESSVSYRPVSNSKQTESTTSAAESPTPASGSRTSQSLTTQQSSTQQQRTTGGEGRISITSIKNRHDFQVFFYGADRDANGFLRYSDIQRALGNDVPKMEELQRFDEDSDHMYSYLELLKAFTLTD